MPTKINAEAIKQRNEFGYLERALTSDGRVVGNLNTESQLERQIEEKEEHLKRLKHSNRNEEALPDILYLVIL